MTDRELEAVEPTALTCEQVDERDLEAAYLGGRLGEQDAAAYEAHLFACDRCWAVFRTAQSVAGVHQPTAARARSRWPVPLALAAGVAAVVAGTVWLSPLRQAPTPDALRGAADSVAITLDARGGAVALHFGAIPGADQYRIRLFSTDGELLEERTTPDTTLSLTPRTDRRPVGQPSDLWVEVAALDPLLEVIASSGLVRIARPPQTR